MTIKQLLPRSLLGRSLLIIVLPILLVQAISIWVFYDRHYETVTKRLTKALAGDLALVVTLLTKAETSREQTDLFRLFQRTAELSLSFHTDVQLSDSPQNHFNWQPGWSVLDRRLNNALSGSLRHRRYRIDTDSLGDQIKVEIETNGGVLLALVPRKRLFTTTTHLVTFWMLGSSLFFFAIATLFMRGQVRPIQRLARAADHFGRGQGVSGFKPEGAREVRQAAVAFLRMRARITRQIENRTTLLAGVSHDLRTPLTRMKLELALQRNDNSHTALREDIAEMESMIDGYLGFVRSDGGEKTCTVSLQAFIETTLAPFQRGGDEKMTLTLRDGKQILLLQPQAMKRALTNLITNAQHVAQRIEITAQKNHKKNHVVITIDDDGPGIPTDKRADVLKPFFRLDPSRNHDTGGQGLGLSIAQDIITAQGGTLTLDTSPLGGLRAQVTLPL